MPIFFLYRDVTAHFYEVAMSVAHGEWQSVLDEAERLMLGRRNLSLFVWRPYLGFNEE